MVHVNMLSLEPPLTSSRSISSASKISSSDVWLPEDSEPGVMVKPPVVAEILAVMPSPDQLMVTSPRRLVTVQVTVMAGIVSCASETDA